MPASTYLSNKLLDHQTGTLAYVMPTVYVGLSSTTPAISGTGVTEPSTGGYARVITSAATWQAAAAGATQNNLAITFPLASAPWVASALLTHGVLYDAPVGGNLLCFGILGVAKNILTGDTARIDVGDLDITLT